MKTPYSTTDKPYFPPLNRLGSLKLHILCTESPAVLYIDTENHPLKSGFLLLFKRNNGLFFFFQMIACHVISVNLSAAGVHHFERKWLKFLLTCKSLSISPRQRVIERTGLFFRIRETQWQLIRGWDPDEKQLRSTFQRSIVSIDFSSKKKKSNFHNR